MTYRMWPGPAASALSDDQLLSDEQVLDFVINGYHVVRPALPPEFHDDVYRRLEPRFGTALLDKVPPVATVYDDPAVRGAVVSLLGADARLNAHHNLHVSGPVSQYWHQDSRNRRHHQLWRLFAMYYPQTVTAEMGPTVIVPGSHLRMRRQTRWPPTATSAARSP